MCNNLLPCSGLLPPQCSKMQSSKYTSSCLWYLKKGGGEGRKSRKKGKMRRREEGGKGGREEDKREREKAKSNLMTFLQFKKSPFPPFQDDVATPDITNNCNKWVWQHKKCLVFKSSWWDPYILYTVCRMFFAAGESNPKTLDSLWKGARIAVLKAPDFGCLQSSILFIVILGTFFICISWRFFPWF